MQAAADQRITPGAWCYAAAILLAGALLRLLSLGHEGLWCDEGYTALTAAKPIPELIGDLARHDDAVPLFYLLVRAAVLLLGDSEFVVRLVPALAGIAAILYLLAQARQRRSAGLLHAAAVLALAPLAIFYARQAREYSLLMLFALPLIFGGADLLRGRRGGPRVVLGGALLGFTHNLGLLLIAASAAGGLLLLRRAPALLRWLGWHALALLPALLWWLAVGWGQLETHASGNQWIAPFWRSHPLGIAPLHSLGLFVPGVAPGAALQVAFPRLDASLLWRALSALAALICLLAAVRAGARRARPVELPLRYLGALLLLPLIALALLSAVWTPAYILGRTDGLAFLPFALLIGVGLARLPRLFAAAALLGWGLITLFSLAPSYGWELHGSALPEKGSDRQIARFLAETPLREGDVIVHGRLTAPSIEYHLRRFGAAHTPTWFPASAGENPAAAIPLPVDSLADYLEEARRKRDWIEAHLPPGGMVWILATLETGAPEAPEARRTGRVRAMDLRYPTNLLVYRLAGLEPQPVARFYRQDWIAGERLLLRLPPARWMPPSQLPRIQLEEGASAPDASRRED
ncbi:MAG: hypothetical protein GF330_05340 [Candidatus Eisenbacteria bacterium]|nr:hypothetical protein [Candidatus Eisenbacteria bacterium]